MRRANASIVLFALALVALGTGTGCESSGTVKRDGIPTLADTATRVNAAIQGSERLRARATVQVRYTDEEGARRFEQGEGLFRMESSGAIALSAGKVGETLFWLGCDDRRYWWFDLAGKERTAFVGLHDGPGQGRGGVASAVNPRALPRLMGRVPISGRGTCEWSSDGKLLGVTTRLSSGYERRWLDPKTLEATKIEVYDDARQPVLIADLGKYEFMTIAGQGAPGPRVPTTVFIGHPATGTELRLYLEDPDDGGQKAGAPGPAMDPAAFDFIKLSASLRVSRTIDLDAEAKR